MREDLSKVVVTDSYKNAASALDKYGFVLLIGEPASGKTTIASMLSMVAADNWGSSLLKLNRPDEIQSKWNPEEPSQLFWIDDSFGITQYDASLSMRWNANIPQMKAMLISGVKIIMTSRDYIYRRARSDLKQDVFPLLNEGKVVIDIQNISLKERKQILYNHIKNGKQNRQFRTQIKKYLEGIAAHKNFTPEIARRLSEPFFTKKIIINKKGINDFVERQESVLVDILSSIDQHSKAAFSLIYMRNNNLESPVRLNDDEAFSMTRMGSSIGECIKALQYLSPGLVILNTNKNKKYGNLNIRRLLMHILPLSKRMMNFLTYISRDIQSGSCLRISLVVM